MILPTLEEIDEQCWRIGELRSTLRPTQKEMHQWWTSNDAVLSIIHARRGFGKTWFMLTLAFEHMAKFPRSRQVYAAPSREECKKIVLPTAALIIPQNLPRDVRPVWNASGHMYVHPNGATLVVEGADDDQGQHLRGPFADIVYMDEMGFWRMPAHVWKAVLWPMVERRNGRAIGVSTSPESPMHEFGTEIIPEAMAEGAYVKVTLDDDYTLEQHQRDRIAAQYSKKRDPKDGRKNTIYRREYGCELVTESERAVLPEFSIEDHVAEHERSEFFDPYVIGDHGFVDLTHILFCHYDFASATIIVEDELAMHHVTISELAPLILKKEVGLWADHKVYKRASDAPPIVLAEFARQHVLQPDIVPREMRFASVENREPEALLNRTRALLASRRIKINPRCEELIKQCSGLLWNDRRTDFEKIPGLYHGDGVMALAYTVDQIDYQRNAEIFQKKYNRELYPTHRLETPRDRQTQSLQALLPKKGRRPERKRHEQRLQRIWK